MNTYSPSVRAAARLAVKAAEKQGKTPDEKCEAIANSKDWNPLMAEDDSESIELESADDFKAWYEAELARLELEEKQDKNSDKAHFVYRFNGHVDEDSCSKAIDQLARWDRFDKAAPISFIINSPGGYIADGMSLFDDLRMYSKRGGGRHKVTTVVRGMAASMGSVLLQAGDNRIVGPNSLLLLHEPSSGIRGTVGDITDELHSLNLYRSMILDLYAERSNLHRDELNARWERRDWWINASEAINFGVADRIG